MWAVTWVSERMADGEPAGNRERKYKSWFSTKPIGSLNPTGCLIQGLEQIGADLVQGLDHLPLTMFFNGQQEHFRHLISLIMRDILSLQCLDCGQRDAQDYHGHDAFGFIEHRRYEDRFRIRCYILGAKSLVPQCERDSSRCHEHVAVYHALIRRTP
jgi:hypothetical protein